MCSKVERSALVSNEFLLLQIFKQIPGNTNDFTVEREDMNTLSLLPTQESIILCMKPVTKWQNVWKDEKETYLNLAFESSALLLTLFVCTLYSPSFNTKWHFCDTNWITVGPNLKASLSSSLYSLISLQHFLKNKNVTLKNKKMRMLH